MGVLNDAYVAGLLNLASSLLVFLPSVLVIWHYRVKQFEEHRYLSYAFFLWSGQWFASIVVWASYSPLHLYHAIGQTPRVQSCAVLAALDASIVAAMGFYWSYAKAEEFQWKEALRNLIGLYAFLLLWNMLLSPLIPNERWNWVWALPSEVLTIVTTGLVATTFWLRFGPTSLPLSAVVIPVYAMLQMPTYASLLLERTPDDAAWMTALAIVKLVYGLLFYSLFFSPARTYQAVKLPKLCFRVGLADRMKLAGASFGAALFSTAVTQLAHWLSHGGAYRLGHVFIGWLPS